MSNENLRNTFDARLLKSTALPAAGASNVSATLDLGTFTAGRIPQVELDIQLPATPNLADAKTVTLTVNDSADGVTFVAVADLPAVAVTGAGGVGAAAVDRRFKLPITIRRYIQLGQAVAGSGGDNTGVSSQIALVF